MKNVLKAAVAGLALVAAAHSHAATTWDYSVSSATSVTSLSVTGTLSGLYASSNTAAVQTGTANSNLVFYGSGSGWGVGAEGVPLHAVDSNSGYEFILLSFSQRVNLTGVKIGYNGSTCTDAGCYTDATKTTRLYGSDMSLLAYTGTASNITAPTSFTNGDTLTTMIGAQAAAPNTSVTGGWSVIGNYANVGTMANNTALVNTSVYSNYWLVGAYDSLFGAGGSGNPQDLFKFLAVNGNVCSTQAQCGTTTTTSVPEPGSLALLGVALVAAGYVRRRNRKG